jgi:dihydroorotase
MKIEILNGHLIDPRNGIDAKTNLYIAAGRVVGVGQAPAGWQANKTYNAQDLIVCPGLVDASVRLREPGFEYRATLETEMQAAISSGVTSLVCPPDTEPVLDEPALVEMLKSRAKALNQAHVYPLGALTIGLKGKNITEMSELMEAGCVGFSQAAHPITDTRALLRAMQYAATFDYPVWLQAQDHWLAQDGVAHDGEYATRMGLPGIPALAESLAVSQLLQLAALAGCHLHLCRLSSAAGVDLVRQAKKAGQRVSCDVSINNLHLCDVDIGYFDTHCALNPPLRGQSDRTALSLGLADGTIDCLVSDHSPVDDDAKELPFSEAEQGATGVELLLSLALKWAQENKVTLSTALSRITDQPARLLALPGGHLSVGAAADVCVFDAKAYRNVSRASLISQGRNTPFLGYEMPAINAYTFVSGQLVFERTL